MKAQQTVGYGEITRGSGEKVSYDGSTQSAAAPANTSMVRVICSTDAYVEISSNPTASATTSTFMPAGLVEYFAAGVDAKVAAIKSAAAGTMYVRWYG